MHEFKKVVKISSNIGTGCSECKGFAIGLDNFAESINHYIQQHGYKLLHVGSETTHDNEGNLYQTTVAVLGRD